MAYYAFTFYAETHEIRGRVCRTRAAVQAECVQMEWANKKSHVIPLTWEEWDSDGDVLTKAGERALMDYMHKADAAGVL